MCSREDEHRQLEQSRFHRDERAKASKHGWGEILMVLAVALSILWTAGLVVLTYWSRP